jgi:hypothetical protein
VAVAPDDFTTIHKRNKEMLQERATELFMCTEDQLSLRPLDERLSRNLCGFEAEKLRKYREDAPGEL